MVHRVMATEFMLLYGYVVDRSCFKFRLPKSLGVGTYGKCLSFFGHCFSLQSNLLCY